MQPGDLALIGPGAQVALNQSLSGVTIDMTAAGSGGAGQTPVLGIGNATLSGTVIQTTGTGLLSADDNAQINLAGAVTNAGVIRESPPGGYGGKLVLTLGPGAVLTNTGTIAGAALGTLSLGGSGGAIVNDGTISGDGTGMALTAPVGGTGLIELLRGPSPGSHWGTQSTLEIAGGVGPGQTVLMQDAVLKLDDPAAFQGTIRATDVLPVQTGAPQSTIELPGHATSASVSGGTLLVYDGQTVTARLAVDPAMAADSFSVSNDSGIAAIHIGPGGSNSSPASASTDTPSDSPGTSPVPSVTSATSPNGGASESGSGGTSAGQALAVLDTTTHQAITPDVTAYSGPVSGLQEQFVTVTSDSLNVTANTPGWFIHTGSGDDAIAASGGSNVLDGGTGSNFLTGGSGTDTFFVDDRNAGADIWSTVEGFHSGDFATVWGIAPGSVQMDWEDGQGAAGHTGLTLHALAPGKPTASLTLGGYSKADLTNGRLTVAFGTDPASGSQYMSIHAN